MSGFRSITTLPHSIFASICKELLPAIVIRSLMEEKRSMHRLKGLKERHFLCE